MKGEKMNTEKCSKQNMYQNRKGFTLLELLVVVLIIGILAAIALPQYKKAVAKAQFAQIVMATKSLKSATDRYFLAHDQYTNNINDLDITIDSNINCIMNEETSGASLCYNEKFALWRYKQGNILECAAKTQDENSALAQVCKDFTKNQNCGLSSGASTCWRLGLKPCFRCQDTSSTL